MALLSVNEVSKENRGRLIVKNVSFQQEAAQNIAIAGETGSGKTTLLKLIGGLTQLTSGQILFENKKIKGPDDQLIPGHHGIAYLSQYFELRNNYWVHDLLEMSNQLTEAQAAYLYSICQIEHLTNRRTDQLSGGEKQRIALARLLTTSPRLLLLDEPFSNLDAVHKRTIKNVIRDLSGKMNISCIMVSHDAADIISWADQILLMKDGELIQRGTPQQVYQQPANEYCAGLLGDYNLIDKENVHLFSAIPGIQQNGKQFLIRPEQFTITTKNEHSIKGIVEQVLFWGAYSTADVHVNGLLLRVKTSMEPLVKGQEVYLGVAPGDIWYL